MALQAKQKHTNLIWQPDTIPGVMIGQALEDGPTVGIIGGIHGDEPAGIEIINLLPKYLNVKRGRVIVVMGNLKAIAAGTRMVETNLNRAFQPLSDKDLENSSNLPYETTRAQELMSVIDQCDAILDLHEYEDPNGTPLIICERESLAIAKQIGPAAIAFGFSQAEPGGTDGYAHSRGIQAICYELGEQSGKHQTENVRLGKDVVHRFLVATGLTDATLKPFTDTPLLVQVNPTETHIRTGDIFQLTDPDFRSFQLLEPGQLIAVDGDQQVRADAHQPQAIIFPKPNPAKGREAFELADVVQE